MVNHSRAEAQRPRRKRVPPLQAELMRGRCLPGGRAGGEAVGESFSEDNTLSTRKTMESCFVVAKAPSPRAAAEDGCATINQLRPQVLAVTQQWFPDPLRPRRPCARRYFPGETHPIG